MLSIKSTAIVSKTSKIFNVLKAFEQQARRMRLGPKLFRSLLAASLVGALWLFVKVLSAQNASYDANARIAEMLKSKRIVILESWSLNFKRCEQNDRDMSTCFDLEEVLAIPKVLKFPAAETMPAMVALFKEKPTLVTLKYKLTQTDRIWLAEHDKAVIAFPRSVQNRVRSFFNGTANDIYGVGSNVIFGFNSREVLDAGEIALEFNMDTLDYVGPTDFPIVLSETEAADDYIASNLRLQFSANLASQMEMGFPVLLAAVAIVLDHSVVFGLASLYSVFRAGRGFINFAFQESLLVATATNQNILAFCNGIVFSLLIIFVLEISALRPRKTWILICGVLGSAFLSVIWRHFDSNYSLTLDLWADTLSAGISLPILVTGVVFQVLRWKKKIKASTKSEELTNLGQVLFFARALILCGGLSLHFWVNFSELLKISSSELKNPLDWKHSMMFPVLITVALFEVGSVARKMIGFAKVMAESAVLEKEVALARDMQQRTLPVRKHDTESWQWRAFYYPASALAGDWFDVRELKFADGRLLLASVVVDITGHGVGPALVTSVLCSQWGLWCSEITKNDAPTDTAQVKLMLSEASMRMHFGLLALGKGDACTAVLSLIDAEKGEIVYVTGGHPGILMQSGPDKKVRYLRSPATSLGSSVGSEKTLASWPAGAASFPEGALICLYSDGLVALDVPITSWVKNVERTVRKTEQSITQFLVHQLRQNKKDFHARPEEEDDMTLVVLQLKKGKAETLDKKEAESAPQSEVQVSEFSVA